jgi:hypothetical protein
MTPDASAKRAMLRHLLATMVYRAGKATRNAPPGFGDFRASETARTPVQIVAHIGDLCDWGLSSARGQEVWRDAMPQPWEAELGRFYAKVKAFDDYLASSAPLLASAERLAQGPVADAISHVGQISMLRRLFGNPIRGESYYRADIKSGQVGPDQPAPKREFD